MRFLLKLLKRFNLRRVSNYCLLGTLDVMTAAHLYQQQQKNDGAAVPISNYKILRKTDLDKYKDKILSLLIDSAFLCTVKTFINSNI